MKRTFLSVLLMVVVALPTGVNAQGVSASEAYKAIVKIRAYTSGLDGFLTNWQWGTGVIIDPKGIILTNEHVISVQYAYDDSESTVGHQVCLTTDIAKEPDCAFTAKVIAADKNSDLALLQIVPIAGLSSMTTFPYIEPQTSSVAVNEEVSALGYPEVGGSTISTTKGIISGKQDKYGQSWLKIDAVTSFGSSGGALINAAGKLVGVTTEVHSDLAGSLGFAVDVSSVLPWINAMKTGTPVTSALQDRVQIFTAKQRNRNASNTFMFDGYDFGITKPNGWEFTYDSEDRLIIFNPFDGEGGYVVVALSHYEHPLDFNYFDLLLKSELADNVAIARANFVRNEIVPLNGVQAKRVQISGIEVPVDQYFIPNQDVGIQLLYGFGQNDKDALTVNTILNSITRNPRVAPTLLQQYVNLTPSFSLKTNPDWYIRKLDGKTTPFELYGKDYSAMATPVVEKKTEQTRGLTNDSLLQTKEKAIENAVAAVKNVNLGVTLMSKNAHVRLSDQAIDTIAYELKYSNLTTGETLLYAYNIIIPTANDYISLTMRYFGADQTKYETKLASFKAVMSTFSFSAIPLTPTSTPGPKPLPGAPYDRQAELNAAVSINDDKSLDSATGQPPCTSNTLIKGRSSSAVYYCGANGKRFVFPNFQTYSTWYADFNSVITLTDEQLAEVPLGGVVTYRPGTRMLKITSDPQVYAVGANGELRPIGSEAVAKRLYGDTWNKQIDDISDAFFINYKVGAPITE